MSIFTTSSKDENSKARTGVLNLPHGEVKTPVFMPVGTNATVKAIHHDTIKDMGTNLILSNTYHLYLRPGIEVIKKAGGLHQYSNWQGNILTDSGGFQVFSLSSFRKIKEEGVRFRSHINGSYHHLTPESVVELQEGFGSDIQMALDVCTSPEISHQEATKAMELTTRWAKRSLSAWKAARDERSYPGQLFTIIQGNFFKDLRKISAEQILELDAPGIAIGGLSVGEPFEIFEEYTEYTAQFLPEDKPRYLMGIGTPEYIFTAVENGIDMFDCVLPTRIARNGAVFTSDGMIALKKAIHEFDFGPIEENCSCTACQKYSRSYMRHLVKTGEMFGPMLATEHNLQFLHDLMIKIRKAIEENRFQTFKREFLSRYKGR